MKIVKITTRGYESNCWLIIDEKSGEYAVVDPSASPEAIDYKISDLGLSADKFKYVLLTHGHFDHIYSVDAVREKYECKVCIHYDDADCLVDSYKNANRLFFDEDLVFAPADIKLAEGESLYLGDLEIKVIHTPGHTKGCVCYLAESAMFCGDTLFDRSIGRTDLPGGNTKVLRDSLKRIVAMDDDIKLYPGHGSITNIDEQKQYNPYLKGL